MTKLDISKSIFQKGLRVSPYRILTQYLFVDVKPFEGVCVCFVIATHWHENKVTRDARSDD